MKANERKSLAGSVMNEIARLTGHCGYSSTGRVVIADHNTEPLIEVLEARGVEYMLHSAGVFININATNARKFLKTV